MTWAVAARRQRLPTMLGPRCGGMRAQESAMCYELSSVCLAWAGALAKHVFQIILCSWLGLVT